MEKEQKQISRDRLREIIGAARSGADPRVDRLIRESGYTDPPDEYDFAAMPPRDVTRLFGITAQALAKWRKNGCPCERQKRGNVFSARALMDWKNERDNQERKTDIDEKWKAILDEAEVDAVEEIEDAIDPHLNDGASFYQQLQYKRAATRLGVQIRATKKTLLDASDVRATWQYMAAQMRMTFDSLRARLCRKCRKGFAEELSTRLEEIDLEMKTDE